MSNLLMNEVPLMVQPSLAIKVGLNEALFLQQLHYWLERSTKVIDDKKWIYNTIEKWHEQFPFWSIATIKRIISNLENKKLILSGNYNKLSIDRTKWYTINYTTLKELENENKKESSENNFKPSQQNIDNNSENDVPKAKSSISSICTNGENKGSEASIANKEECSEKDVTKTDISISSICTNGKNHDLESKKEHSENNSTDELSNGSICTNAKYQNELSISSLCTHALAQSEPTNTNNNNIDFLHENNNNTINVVAMKKNLTMLAVKCGIKAANMRVFFKSFKLEKIEKQLLLLEKAILKGNIKNPAGWLRTALIQDFEDNGIGTVNAEKKRQAKEKADKQLALQMAALKKAQEEALC